MVFDLDKKYTRKDFLKLAGKTGAGFFLASWGLPSLLKSGAHAAEGTADDDVLFVFANEADYDRLRQGFNKRIRKQPRVIALCKNTRGVTRAVQYARANHLPIAIKSGGHCFEGFSCNDGGLVVNLSLMNNVEWMDSDTVKLGPACTLSRLYDALLPRKKILPTGSCGGVGIGGLALGGGYGFFSRKYGLTCDSLTEITLVDGNGSIRSSKTDPDLLWACRGGGNGNFGVVTEMTFKTKPAPAWFRGHRFKAAHLDAERAEQILEKWFDVAARLPPSCFSAFVLNHDKLMILLTNFEDPVPEIQKIVETLSSLTEKTSLGAPQELPSAMKTFYGVQTPLYFKNSSAGFYKDFNDIRSAIRAVLENVVQQPGLIYQVNTLGGNIANPQFESGSCFPHRAYPFLSELQSYWDAPGGEAPLLQRCRDIQNLFRKNGVEAHYVNYPNLDFDNWRKAYYGDRYPALQAVKRRYDGDNIFRYEQSIGT